MSLPADMQHHLVQRRNGSWLLVLWRGVGDASARFLTSEAERASLTLAFSTPVARVRRYEPTLAPTLAAALKQRYLSPTSISVSVSVGKWLIATTTGRPKRWRSSTKFCCIG